MRVWRSWLPLALSVVALTLSLLALALHGAEPEAPPAWTALPDVVEARMAQDERALDERWSRNLGELDAALPPAADREALLAVVDAARAAAFFEVATARRAAQEAGLADRATSTTAILGRLEERVASLLAWKARLQAALAQLNTELAAERPGGTPALPTHIPPKKAPPKGAPAVPPPATPAAASARTKRISDLQRMLRSNRDFYARLGAAIALGELRAADAVADLIAGLDDRDELVRTAASEALHVITGHTVPFVSVQPKGERLQVMNRWRVWWKHNEKAVRARLAKVGR